MGVEERLARIAMSLWYRRGQSAKTSTNGDQEHCNSRWVPRLFAFCCPGRIGSLSLKRGIFSNPRLVLCLILRHHNEILNARTAAVGVAGGTSLFGAPSGHRRCARKNQKHVASLCLIGSSVGPRNGEPRLCLLQVKLMLGANRVPRR
jgi:hypothetical protein